MHSRGSFGTAALLLVAAELGMPQQVPGQVFGSPAPLNSTAATDTGLDVTPRIVTDGTGTWVVSWSGPMGDVLFERSTDRGATWSPAAAINPTHATGGGGVQLATDGTVWVAVWEALDQFGGTDEDILTARSVDGGATWSAPQPLNTNAASDTGRDGSAHIATDGAGTWLTVWRSDDSLGGTIGTDGDILFARSTDGGVTWTSPAPVNAYAPTDAAIDDEPRIATDRAGTWLVVWTTRAAPGSDADVLVARTTDAGDTWSAPVAVNTNAATDVGDDHFPRIATDRAGTWLATWTSTDSLGGTIGTDEDILVARSTDDGATWSAPRALDANAATDAGSDTESEITTDGHGTWIAVWYGTTLGSPDLDSDDDIRVARSTDAGITWSLPLPLNDNAARDRIFSESDPDIATDGAGTWIAVFDSPDSLGGTIGTDFDILFARGTDVSCAPAAPSCATPASAPSSVLVLKDRTPDRHDSLLWKWSAVGAPASGDLGTPTLGDPLSGTNYAFCVYDGTGSLVLGRVAPAGGRCGTKPCWRSIGAGFDYRDRELTPEGVARLTLKPPAGGVGRITLKATGDYLAMPALGGFVLPLRAQLQAGTGACWEATFSTPTDDSAQQFRARSP